MNERAEWTAGTPSLRSMAPSVIAGAVVPLVVYRIVRSHVHSDANALIIAGIFPAAWVIFEFIRRRRLDPIGSIVLFGFVAGLIVSTLLGGNAFVLKVRDSVFTSLFGLACLGSLAMSKPLMFYVGRALSAGDDPDKIRAYNELWDHPTAPRVFGLITLTWGIGLLCEAAIRTVLAVSLPTGTFLAAAPVLSIAFYASMFGFTVWYSTRVRRQQEALGADTVAPPNDAPRESFSD